jgi:hypothetical protein
MLSHDATTFGRLVEGDGLGSPVGENEVFLPG